MAARWGRYLASMAATICMGASYRIAYTPRIDVRSYPEDFGPVKVRRIYLWNEYGCSNDRMREVGKREISKLPTESNDEMCASAYADYRYELAVLGWWYRCDDPRWEISYHDQHHE